MERRHSFTTLTQGASGHRCCQRLCWGAILIMVDETEMVVAIVMVAMVDMVEVKEIHVKKQDVAEEKREKPAGKVKQNSVEKKEKLKKTKAIVTTRFPTHIL